MTLYILFTLTMTQYILFAPWRCLATRAERGKLRKTHAPTNPAFPLCQSATACQYNKQYSCTSRKTKHSTSEIEKRKERRRIEREGGREGERERERERQTERQRETERETERDRQTDRQNERKIERTKKEGQAERKKERKKGRKEGRKHVHFLLRLFDVQLELTNPKQEPTSCTPPRVEASTQLAG